LVCESGIKILCYLPHFEGGISDLYQPIGKFPDTQCERNKRERRLDSWIIGWSVILTLASDEGEREKIHRGKLLSFYSVTREKD